METAATIIKSALQEILVQASESDLEADEIQDGIRYLNRMMAKYAAQGITLGYTQVTSLADPITVPDGALDGMVKNLALSLQPQFAAPGTPVSQLLALQAREGLDTMRQIAIQSIGPTFYPDTLPRGSGNEEQTAFRADHFYTTPEEQIELEQGGFISIEQNTENPNN